MMRQDSRAPPPAPYPGQLIMHTGPVVAPAQPMPSSVIVVTVVDPSLPAVGADARVSSRDDDDDDNDEYDYGYSRFTDDIAAAVAAAAAPPPDDGCRRCRPPRPPPLERLPNEVLLHILGFLDVDDLLSASRVRVACPVGPPACLPAR
ncbi:hypothetical protein CDD83_3678 [Cordyceps sp. RAO-2017]|nr:hypothetical protein CDD83_3678 [Cordyceps sp. RAO-2017]